MDRWLESMRKVVKDDRNVIVGGLIGAFCGSLAYQISPELVAAGFGALVGGIWAKAK